MPELASCQVIVHGYVQGVYFRAFTSRAAKALNLKGYVHNVPNGKVEVRIEGDKSNIEKLIKQLEMGPPEAIVEKMDINWSPYSGTFGNFEIGG